MLRETLLFPTAKVNKVDANGDLRFPRMRKRFPKKRKQKKARCYPRLMSANISLSIYSLLSLP